MVLEIASYTAQPGRGDELAAGLQRGAEIIRAAKGCVSVTPRRQIEDPDRFVMTIEWETIEDHITGFRGSPEFMRYRAQIAGMYIEPIQAPHYQTLG